MQINHVDGQKTETDNLLDAEAEILEKTEELRALCAKYKRQLFVVVDARDKKDGEYYTFWNLSNSDLSEIKNPEDHAKLVNPLLKSLNKVIEFFTYGQACIQRIKDE